MEAEDTTGYSERATDQVVAFRARTIQEEQVNSVLLRIKRNLTQEQIENIEKVAIGIIGTDKYKH